MAVTAMGDYTFPSASRQELYGDDQLVHVWWKGNLWFCAAAAYRAPKAMTWADFWGAMVVPFFEEDPDWSNDTQFIFDLDGVVFEPQPTDTLESLGVVHKGVITMVAA